MKIASIALALACNLTAGAAFAIPDPVVDLFLPADLDGTYSLDGVTLDSNAWTDGSTTVTMGQTYAVAVSLSYTNAGSTASYQPSQSATLNIAGQVFGTLFSSAPISSTTDQNCGPIFGVLCSDAYVTSASWTLLGNVSFDESWGAAGTYDVSSTLPGLGRSVMVAAVAQQAPSAVPAPGTLAIFALGLLGLSGARRWKLRR